MSHQARVALALLAWAGAIGWLVWDGHNAEPCPPGELQIFGSRCAP